MANQYYVSDLHLNYAATILGARLVRPSTIDFTIYEKWTNDIEYTFDQHVGRFVGSFDRRPDQSMTFYLAGKSDPDGELDHLFVFYFNSDFKTIQDYEIQQLKTCVPTIGQPNCPLNIGVINVRCKCHPSKYLSALINALDHIIDCSLIQQFREYQYYEIEDPELAILDTVCPVVCSGEFKNDGKLAQLTQLHGRRLVHVKDREANPHVPRCPKEPGAIVIDSRGHLIGAVTDRSTNIVHLILSHRGQFESGVHFDKVKSTIQQAFENKPDIVCTRLYADICGDLECNGPANYYAWNFVMTMLPHALTIIRQNDLLLIYSSRFPMVCPDKGTHMHKLRATTPTSAGSSQNPGPSQSASDISSQSTIIYDHSYARTELSFWKEVSAKRRTIKDHLVPPVHNMRPFADFTNSYLKFLPSYEEALELITRVWSSKVQSYVSFRGLTYHRNEASQTSMDQARFVIFPIMTFDDKPAMVILDKKMREWIYLNPDNADHRDEGYFYTSTVRYTKGLLPELEGHTYRVVPMTSSFHQEYPKVHLLMGLYVIGRLFPYSIGLPHKVIYGEWELRKYASNICAELQLVNAEHNLSNNLVDISGRLLPGALTSLPSPLQYQASVVPKDQCMFCKKRGFKSLSRHMCMAHGGQASSANFERRLAWEE